MLPTKTRPKRLTLVGTDGNEYTYLLKGREDLHLDERSLHRAPSAHPHTCLFDNPPHAHRIMQLLRVVNTMLASDRRTRSHAALRARHYAVLPLGPRSGLIQWVEGVTPLYSIYRASQHRAAAAAPKPATDADAPTAPPRVLRPADQFYSKLGPVLELKGIKPNAPRREWPRDVLRRAPIP